MPRGRIAALIFSAAVAALGPGCQLEQKGAAAPEPRPDPPKERKAAPERKPYRAGDYIVYPLQWRNAEETAYELYALFYPKYGPTLQIIPDRDTNSLLIYLPPEERRFYP